MATRTLSSWPADLPNPTTEGYQISRGDLAIRTEMTAGPARVRRMYTTGRSTLAIQWQMSGSELKKFRGFFRTTIDHGTKSFLMNLWMSDSIQSGMEVRFVGGYTSAYQTPSLWLVTASLELIDDPEETAP